MRILHVCSEYYPLLKTGGLADVIGSLPKALNQLGQDTRVLLPAFPAIWQGIKAEGEHHKITSIETFAGRITLYFAKYQGVSIYLIDAPSLYNRPGSPYHDNQMNAYHDNPIRFALLGFMGCELAKGLDGFWRPDVVNAHDWHAGLTCAYLALNNYPAKAVFTIHNLAYSGCFSYQYGVHHNGHYYEKPLLDLIGLPNHFFSTNGLEFYQQISFLKAGLFYANHITTVSPTYAEEICTPAFGCGFDGLLQSKRSEGKLTGILNGVDYDIWSPKKDSTIKQPYDKTTLTRKISNKTALQDEFDLTVNPIKPIFAVVSRLSWQKGLDLVEQVVPQIIENGGQLVLLGTGEAHLQHAFEELANKYPDDVAVVIGYDEALAHRIIAGADITLVPSRFEPCGLTQLYSLQYGTLPLVRRTGGLADSVFDASLENLDEDITTGFVFERETIEDLSKAIKRSFVLWKNFDKWEQVQSNAMDSDFSWDISAQSYLQLYQTL